MPLVLDNYAPIQDRGQEGKMVGEIRRRLEESANDKMKVAGNNHETWRFHQSCYDGTNIVPRPWWAADVRSNKLKARVDRIVGLYVGDRPRVSYEPMEVDDSILAKQVDKLQGSDWHNGGLDRELRASVLDACVVGTAFWKTYYDAVSKRIRSRRVNPEHIFVDPDSDLSLLSADFIAEVASQPLDKVARLYPFAFKDDSVNVTEGQLYSLGDNLPYAYTPPPPPGTSFPFSSITYSAFKGQARARVLLYQFWIRDIGTVDWLLDADALRRIKDENIRSAVVTLAGNHVLKIEKSPYRTGWHPYTVFRSQLRPNSWWGRGDVEAQMSAQVARDLILSRATHHVQLTINPTWGINEQLIGDMPPRFEQIPGNIIRTNGDPNQAFKALHPPQLGGEVLGFMAMLDSDNDDVTGVNEAAQGRKPKGIESGKAINALQAQLAERLQPRLDDLRESLKSYGRRYIDLALAEYSQKEVERILGKTDAIGWKEYAKEAAGEFDVQVQVGTGVELDPETLLESGIQLYQMGVFGQPGSPEATLQLLKSIRRFWPDAEAQIRKLEKAQNAQFNEAASAEAQASGATAPSPGGMVPPPTPPPLSAPQPAPAPPVPAMV